jgi:hypothetical protein
VGLVGIRRLFGEPPSLNHPGKRCPVDRIGSPIQDFLPVGTREELSGQAGDFYRTHFGHGLNPSFQQ